MQFSKSREQLYCPCNFQEAKENLEIIKKLFGENQEQDGHATFLDFRARCLEDLESTLTGKLPLLLDEMVAICPYLTRRPHWVHF